MNGKEKSWFVYLLWLLLFAPIGIYFLWKDKKTVKPVRITLSIFFALFFLSLVYNLNPEAAEKTDTSNTTVSEDLLSAQKDIQIKTSKETDVPRGILKTKSYTYNGYIKNGVPYKSGTFIFENGNSLTGNISEGTVTGNAKLTFVDGDVYSGRVLNNVPNGKGKYTTKDGDVIEGTWKNGVLTGNVKVTYVSGDIYEGETLDKVKNGKGTMYFQNGDIYEGNWAKDTYNGVGKYTFVDFQYYEGEWKDGLLNGNVKYKDASGIIYSGIWENGKCIKINTKEKDN